MVASVGPVSVAVNAMLKSFHLYKGGETERVWSCDLQGGIDESMCVTCLGHMRGGLHFTETVKPHDGDTLRMSPFILTLIFNL